MLTSDLTHVAVASQMSSRASREDLPQLRLYLQGLRNSTESFRGSSHFQAVSDSISASLTSFVSSLLQVRDFEAFLLSLEALAIVIYSSPSIVPSHLLSSAAARLIDEPSPIFLARRFNLLLILGSPRLRLTECWQRLCDLINPMFSVHGKRDHIFARLPVTQLLSPVAYEVMTLRAREVSELSSPGYFRLMLRPQDVQVDFSQPLNSIVSPGSQIFRGTIVGANISCAVVGPFSQQRPSRLTMNAFLIHPRIQPYYGWFSNEQGLYNLLYIPTHRMDEIISSPSLTSNSVKSSCPLQLKNFSIRERLRFAVHVLEALDYIHRLGLYTLTLTPQDILFFYRHCHAHPMLDPTVDPGWRVALSPFVLRLSRSEASLSTVVEEELHMLLAPERIAGLYSPIPSDAYSAATDMYSFGFILWSLLHCLDPLQEIRQLSLLDYLSTRAAGSPALSDPSFRSWFLSRSATPLPMWLPNNAVTEVDLLGEMKSPHGIEQRDQLLVFNVLTRCWTEARGRITAGEALRTLKRIADVPTLQELCVRTINEFDIDVSLLPSTLLPLLLDD